MSRIWEKTKLGARYGLTAGLLTGLAVGALAMSATLMVTLGVGWALQCAAGGAVLGGLFGAVTKDKTPPEPEAPPQQVRQSRPRQLPALAPDPDFPEQSSTRYRDAVTQSRQGQQQYR